MISCEVENKHRVYTCSKTAPNLYTIKHKYFAVFTNLDFITCSDPTEIGSSSELAAEIRNVKFGRHTRQEMCLGFYNQNRF